jgi:hypothetical protein
MISPGQDDERANSLELEKIDFVDGTVKKKKGRPSRINQRMIERICSLYKMGATDAEVQKFFGISENTLQRWKKSESFALVIKECKAYVNNQVEQSLLKRALGYEFDEQYEYTNRKGEQYVGTRTKHVVADVTAIAMWLNNRSPERWRRNGNGSGETAGNYVKFEIKLDELRDQDRSSLVRGLRELISQGHRRELTVSNGSNT